MSQISTLLSAHCQYSKLSLKQTVTIPVTKLSLAAAIPWKPHSHLGPEQDHLATFAAPHFMQRSRRRKFLTCLVFPLCCKPESWIDDIAWPCHTLPLRNKRCLVICNLTSWRSATTPGIIFRVCWNLTSDDYEDTSEPNKYLHKCVSTLVHKWDK